MKDYLANFVKVNDTKAISYISECLANKDLTSAVAEAVIKHSQLKMEEK